MAEVAGSLPTGFLFYFFPRHGLRLGAFGGPSRGEGWKEDFAKSFVGPAHGPRSSSGPGRPGERRSGVPGDPEVVGSTGLSRGFALALDAIEEGSFG